MMISTKQKIADIRRFLGLVVTIVGGGILLGGVVPACAAEKVTLIMWASAPSISELRDYRGVEFFKEHPELTMEYTSTPTGEELATKFLIAALGGGELPDMVVSHGFSNQIFFRLVSFMDLTERAAPYLKGYSPGVVRQFSSLDGKVRMLAHIAVGFAHLYREDVYEKFGLTPAETYDEMIENGKKFKAQGWTNFPLVAEINDWFSAWWFVNFTAQAGSGMFDGEGNLALDSPKAIEGMKILKKIYDSGITMDVGGYAGPSWFEALKAKDGPVSSFLCNWSFTQWAKGTIEPVHASYGKWRWKNLPAFYEGGPVYAGGYMGEGVGLGILSRCKNQDLAWEYLEYVTFSLEANLAALQGFWQMCGYLPVMETPEFLNTQFGIFGDQKPMGLFVNILKNQFGDWLLPPAWTEIETPLGIRVSEILRGEVGVEEGLKEFAQWVREDVLPKWPEYVE